MSLLIWKQAEVKAWTSGKPLNFDYLPDMGEK